MGSGCAFARLKRHAAGADTASRTVFRCFGLCMGSGPLLGPWVQHQRSGRSGWSKGSKVRGRPSCIAPGAPFPSSDELVGGGSLRWQESPAVRQFGALAALSFRALEFRLHRRMYSSCQGKKMSLPPTCTGKPCSNADVTRDPALSQTKRPPPPPPQMYCEIRDS